MSPKSKFAAKKTTYKSVPSLLTGSSDNATFKTMLGRRFGKAKNGHPNYDKAAADLGVSKRTIQRWVKNGAPAKSKAGSQAASEMASWSDSPEGRRSRLSPRREQRLRQGFQAKVSGVFKISDDPRPRRDVGFDISAEHANAMFDAYLAGDDAAVAHALNDAAADGFGGSVNVQVHGIHFADGY